MKFAIVKALDGSSMFMDILLPTFLARAITASISNGQGYYDTEVLDAETEKTTSGS